MERIKNVGIVDRTLRVLIGALAAVIGLGVLLPSPDSAPAGALGVALVALGVDFVYTGLTGYCPLYHRLGWSSFRNKTPSAGEGSRSAGR